MAALKTARTSDSVPAFLDAVVHDDRRTDCYAVLELMRDVTGEEPAMWGPGIVGFGSYHYKYDSGREGDWFLTGFSPRKQELTLYIMSGFERYDEVMARLGKFRTGKSCLYIKRLSDVDTEALRTLIEASIEHLRGT